MRENANCTHQRLNQSETEALLIHFADFILNSLLNDYRKRRYE
jgi:hypothetical protein